MSYPKKEITTNWGTSIFVEMTSEDYEQCLKTSRDLAEKFANSTNRRDREYGEYLKRWFSEEICDGAPFSLKYKWHRLPMTCIQYMWG